MIKGLLPDQAFEAIIDWSSCIGEGRTRDVFAVTGESDWVIKYNKSQFNHDNFVEWIVWNALVRMGDDVVGNRPNPNLKDQFAECIAISMSGKYLAMERLAPAPTGTTHHGFPLWLNDRKPNNLGVSKGQIKACDYAMVDLYNMLNPLNWAPAP